MTIYLALAIFPVLLGSLFPKLKTDRQEKIKFYLICGAAMLLVLGLRHYSLGSTDTYHYYNAMKRALASKTWDKFYNPDLYEVGSQLFIFLLSRVFNHPQWLLVISSLVFIVSVFYFVDHNSDDIPLSITLYLTLGLMMFEMQGMRQSLAMSICLFAYEQAKNKHLVRFVALILFAMAFHQTAIVFLPVYIICRMKFSKKNLLLMSIASLFVLYNAKLIISIANNYFDRDYNTTVNQGGAVAVLIYVIVLIFALVVDKEIRNNSAQTPLLYILIIGFISYILRYFGTQAAERISFYFMFSQLALLPNTIKSIVKDERVMLRTMIIFFAVALLAYRLYDSYFVPYMFFWEG